MGFAAVCGGFIGVRGGRSKISSLENKRKNCQAQSTFVFS
jgi:hypothetical protein